MSLIRANRTAVATLWLAFAVAAPLARNARAEPAPNDAAMAETLFEDAKKRMATGDYAGACPKLAESYRLDPGGGTLTALALCHEQLGKTATAWAEFIEVVTDAQQAGRADREKFARQHVTALAPHLSQLTISVAPETAALAEVQVRRDGVVVGSAVNSPAACAPRWAMSARRRSPNCRKSKVHPHHLGGAAREPRPRRRYHEREPELSDGQLRDQSPTLDGRQGTSKQSGTLSVAGDCGRRAALGPSEDTSRLVSTSAC